MNYIMVAKKLVRLAKELTGTNAGWEVIEAGKSYASDSGDKLKINSISFQAGLHPNNLTVMVDYSYETSAGRKGTSKASGVDIIKMLRS